MTDATFQSFLLAMSPPDCYHCPHDSYLVSYSLGIILGGMALKWQHIGSSSFYHNC